MLFRGHEIWMEYEAENKPGVMADCLLMFGHHMQKDGCFDPGRAGVSVVHPAGGKQALRMCFDADRPDGLVASFTPEREGFHTMLAKYDGGVWGATPEGRYCYFSEDRMENAENAAHYLLYANAIIPVGQIGEIRPDPLGCEFEIVPEKAKRFAIGEDFRCSAFYEGSRLSTEFIVVRPGRKEAVRLMAQADQPLCLKLDAEGYWLFIANHRDPSKGEVGRFAAKDLTAAYTLLV